MKTRAFAGGCKKVREKCKKGLHFAAGYGKMKKTGLREGRMKLVRWIKKHICSLAVIGATLLMLAVMLVPLFLPVDDLNGNGRSDAADLVLGARAAVAANPVYDASYVKGYPPETAGACTDVIWRAFAAAGYSLRDMVDADIAANPSAYPNVAKRDRNIDYRRVVNLHIFFSRYAEEISTDKSDPSLWQPGDIVIFRDDRHIGIISDRTNADGLPLVIHHSILAAEEADYLPGAEVTAHYRFDVNRLPRRLRIAWE